MFESKTMVTATKKYYPTQPQIKNKLESQLPLLQGEAAANYFVEIHDELLTNYRYYNEVDDDINEINRELICQDKNTSLKIGLVFMGK